MRIIQNILNVFRSEAAASSTAVAARPAAPEQVSRDPLDADVDLIISVLKWDTGHDYEPGRDAITKAIRKQAGRGHMTCSFNRLGLSVDLPYLDIIEAHEYETHVPGYANLEDIYPDDAMKAGKYYVWSNGPRIVRDVTPTDPE